MQRCYLLRTQPLGVAVVEEPLCVEKYAQTVQDDYFLTEEGAL